MNFCYFNCVLLIEAVEVIYIKRHNIRQFQMPRRKKSSKKGPEKSHKRGRPAVQNKSAVLAMSLKFEHDPRLTTKQAAEKVISIWGKLDKKLGRRVSPPSFETFCASTLRTRVNQLMKPVFRHMKARKGIKEFTWTHLGSRGLDEFEVAAIQRKLQELKHEHGILRDFGFILYADEEESLSPQNGTKDSEIDASIDAGHSSSWCQVSIDAGHSGDDMSRLPSDSLQMKTSLFEAIKADDIEDTADSHLARPPATASLLGTDPCAVDSADGSWLSELLELGEMLINTGEDAHAFMSDGLI